MSLKTIAGLTQVSAKQPVKITNLGANTAALLVMVGDPTTSQPASTFGVNYTAQPFCFILPPGQEAVYPSGMGTGQPVFACPVGVGSINVEVSSP
jgi:hypothetical protein